MARVPGVLAVSRRQCLSRGLRRIRGDDSSVGVSRNSQGPKEDGQPDVGSEATPFSLCRSWFGTFFAKKARGFSPATSAVDDGSAWELGDGGHMPRNEL
jgi:hypothetical protein